MELAPTMAQEENIGKNPSEVNGIIQTPNGRSSYRGASVRENTNALTSYQEIPLSRGCCAIALCRT
jgi:hypothetical protein